MLRDLMPVKANCRCAIAPVACWLAAWCLIAASPSRAEDRSESLPAVKHQVTGLFSVDRVRDLEAAVKKIPEIELVRVDYGTAEATFRYDAAKVFPQATPEQMIERFDNLLKQASRHTFGIKPLCTTPRKKMKFVEIPVVGLDCKACCLAAYESIYKLEGVEQATASFKDGLVTAWIHPDKIDVGMLEEALTKRNVTLKNRAGE